MVIDCHACKLRATCTQPVWGDGPKPCAWMLVGEAPGEEEDASGVPFCGPAGKQLERLLALAGLTRRDIFITNLVRCRPPDNRDPTRAEISACSGWLEQELERVNPSVVILAGRFALARWFPDEKISMVHGVPRQREGRTFVPMYHPAAALHNPSLLPAMNEDWSSLNDKLSAVRLVDVDYRLVHDAYGYVPQLAIDTESDDTLVCVTASPAPGQAIMLYGEDTSNLDLQADVLVMQNAKYDLQVLGRAGLATRLSYNTLVDTMIAAYLLNEPSMALKQLAAKYLNEDMEYLQPLLDEVQEQKTAEWLSTVSAELSKRLRTSLEEVIASDNSTQLLARRHALRRALGEMPVAKVSDIPVEKLLSYACADADMTGRLWPILRQKLEDWQLLELFHEVEMPLVPILAEMETRGITLDIAYMKQLDDEYAARETALEQELVKMAGRPINVNSSSQLAQFVFGELRLAPLHFATKRPSVDHDTLVALRGDPFVDKLMEYKELQKLRSTYTNKLPNTVGDDGRIHARFNQAGATSTGRISSSDPNLQNIPARTDLGLAVRRAFVPQPGWLLLSADYSQIEPRILAHLSQDERLLEAFRNSEDIYRFVGGVLFDKSAEEVTKHERDHIVKPLVLGTNYGLTPYGFAENYKLFTNGLSISEAEASRIIELYLNRFPGIRWYMDSRIEFCRLNGYVSTLWGRRRYIPEINDKRGAKRSAAERAAINMPIQGTAADIMKAAMVRIGASAEDWHMLLQVHDELVFEVAPEAVPALSALVEEAMLAVAKLDVPVDVHIKVGHHWGELK